MVEVVTSPIFKTKVLNQAKAMVQNGENQRVFTDENSKAYEGLTVFIDNKPKQTLFEFSFPGDFPEGSGKKIYVGTN